jgi:hypothetical protein
MTYRLNGYVNNSKQKHAVFTSQLRIHNPRGKPQSRLGGPHEPRSETTASRGRLFLRRWAAEQYEPYGPRPNHQAGSVARPSVFASEAA